MSEQLPDRERWAEGLPRLLVDVTAEWALAPDGPTLHRHSSLLVPVRTTSGRPALLKLGLPDAESEHEHVALQRWHGRGAVQLFRADPRRRALLLERVHTEALEELPDLEGCAVVAALYPVLHVAAPPQLERLSERAARWAEDLAALPRSTSVPHRLVQQAASLARDLATDPATDGRLLHGDLHGGNVLAGDREPWLAVDPKPLSGDPHYEPAAMVASRWEDTVASGDVRGTLRRRFLALVDAAGLDEDRVRDWVVVREVVGAVRGLDRAGTSRELVTRSVTVAKAVQE